MAHEITAKKGDVSASILYDFGEDVDEAIEKFGGDVVYSGFCKSSIIVAQAAIRRYLETGASEEQIQEKLADWKPGVAMTRVVDPVGAILNKFGDMSDEEQGALIDKLREKQG